MTKNLSSPLQKVVFAVLLFLAVSQILTAQNQELHWTKTASGLWIAKVGQPETVNFTGTSEV